MITKNGRLQCDYCGRFIPYLGVYWTWTNYGGCQALEPPDPMHSCDKCYLSLDDRRKELLNNTTWRKPFRVQYEIVNNELKLVKP